MELTKLATILLVEKIEPGIKFWTEILEFKITQQIDHEGKLGFVMLSKGDIEIHLQTRSITEQHAPALSTFRYPPACVLYFDVDNLDELLERMKTVEVVIPKHKTFYGTTEVYVREPCGHVLGFAQIK